MEVQILSAAPPAFPNSKLDTAVIGGVLQNQLATAMHNQAVIFSAQLPPALQGRFVTALSSAVRGGARQLGSAAPSGNDQLYGLAHEVVTHAYVEAMVPTLAVGRMAVALAILGSLAMANVRGARREPLATEHHPRFSSGPGQPLIAVSEPDATAAPLGPGMSTHLSVHSTRQLTRARVTHTMIQVPAHVLFTFR